MNLKILKINLQSVWYKLCQIGELTSYEYAIKIYILLIHFLKSVIITSFAGISLLICNSACPHVRRSWPILERYHFLNLHAFNLKKENIKLIENSILNITF